LLDLTASFSAALNLIAIFCTGRFSRPLEIEITKYGWIYITPPSPKTALDP
jgi:hypothetical protein